MIPIALQTFDPPVDEEEIYLYRERIGILCEDRPATLSAIRIAVKQIEDRRKELNPQKEFAL